MLPDVHFIADWLDMASKEMAKQLAYLPARKYLDVVTNESAFSVQAGGLASWRLAGIEEGSQENDPSLYQTDQTEAREHRAHRNQSPFQLEGIMVYSQCSEKSKWQLFDPVCTCATSVMFGMLP